MGWLRDVVSSAVTVALIVALTRSLSDVKGASLPIIRDGISLLPNKVAIASDERRGRVILVWGRNLVLA